MKEEKYYDKKIDDLFPGNENKNLMLQTFMGMGSILALYIGGIIEKNPNKIPPSVMYAAAMLTYHLKMLILNEPNVEGIMCRDLNDLTEQDEETYLKKIKILMGIINKDLEKRGEI